MRDEPQVGLDGHWYIAAFWDLHTERLSWDPLSPIPRSSVRAWGVEAGLDEELLPGFVYLMRQLDIEWLDDARAEMEKQRAAKEPPVVTPKTRGRRMKR